MVRGWVEEKLASRGTKICWDPHAQGFLSLETGMGEWREGGGCGGLCPIRKRRTAGSTPGLGKPEALLGPSSSTETARGQGSCLRGLGPDLAGYSHFVVPSPCTGASRGFP